MNDPAGIALGNFVDRRTKSANDLDGTDISIFLGREIYPDLGILWADIGGATFELPVEIDNRGVSDMCLVVEHFRVASK